jgi:hypothetical protein
MALVAAQNSYVPVPYKDAITGKKNLGALYQRFPELVNKKTIVRSEFIRSLPDEESAVECIHSVQQSLIKMSDPINYWKLQYSMLYWTDMGSQFYCEDFSKDHSENILSYTTLDSIYI